MFNLGVYGRVRLAEGRKAEGTYVTHFWVYETYNYMPGNKQR